MSQNLYFKTKDNNSFKIVKNIFPFLRLHILCLKNIVIPWVILPVPDGDHITLCPLLIMLLSPAHRQRCTPSLPSYSRNVMCESLWSWLAQSSLLHRPAVSFLIRRISIKVTDTSFKKCCCAFFNSWPNHIFQTTHTHTCRKRLASSVGICFTLCKFQA